MTCTTRMSPITVITVVEVVGVIPKSTNFLWFSCAEAYIGLVCQRTIRISGNNNKLEVWVQIMSQLCKFNDFTRLTGIGNQQQQVVLLQDAQVSVLCFAGVQKYGRNTCGTECRSNVHGNLSGFFPYLRSPVSLSAGESVPR